MSWPQARLGDVTKLIRGITFKPTDKLQPFSEDTVVCMTTRHVQTDLVQDGLFSVSTSFVKREEQYLKINDVLISNANSYNLVGKVCRVPQLEYKAAPGGFISILRVLDDKVLSPGYFYHWINSDSVQLSLRGCARQTTNIANIDTKRMLKLQIPLPPLSEQKRIAEILDCADAIRRTRQETLKTCDELLRSTFLEMFGDPVTNPMGWEVRELGEVTTVITKGESPKWQGFTYQDEGIRFVTSENVLWGSLALYKEKWISEEFALKLKRSSLEEGDLLVNLVGASVGRTAVVTQACLPANINQAVAKITLNQNLILPQFLMQMFINDHFQSRLLGNAVESARANISLTNLRETTVIMPPLSDQMKWRHFYSNILQQLNLIEEQTGLEETLFNSLVQRAFRGEL